MIQPNEHLLGISRIVDHMDERANAVRLDRNERVTPFSTLVFREMLATLTPESFSAYPDPSRLYGRLSRRLELPESYLYLTNGSDAAIRMLFQAYVRPSDSVGFPDPSYAMYAIYTRIFQGQVVTIAYDCDRSLDIGQIVGLIERHPRILVVANPDQPTGAVLPEAVLFELSAACAEAGTLFVIDEAYYPFYPRTAVHLTREFQNVVVTRTFSKIAGLAGLRIGYLTAHPNIVENIQRIRGAHEVNGVAMAIASYMLDHPEIGEAHLREIEEGREVLAEVARELSLVLPACPTNFQLVQFPEGVNLADIVASLKEKGYLVKGPFSSPAVRLCIRVTLGGAEVMSGFAEALREVARGTDLTGRPGGDGAA